jgi:hypothetical protein
MRIVFTLLVVVCGLCFPNSSSASLIDYDTYTEDTETGLDWLDLTQSVDTFPKTDVGSYDYISSQFGLGGDFEGWRYATILEVIELTDKYNSKVLMSLLGTTEYSWNSDEDGWIHFAFGLYDALDTEISGVGKGQLTWYEYNNNEFFSYDYSAYQKDFSNEHVGSFLVRSSVPEPSSFILMFISVLYLIIKKLKVGCIKCLTNKNRCREADTLFGCWTSPEPALLCK